MKAKNALSLALAAGVASTAMASGTPEGINPLDASHKLIGKDKVELRGHIYYNIATGEMIMNTPGQEAQIGAIDEGSEIWINESPIQITGLPGTAFVPCAAAGTGNETFGPALFGVDSPNGTVFTSLNLGSIAADFGGIETDTVVDCVRVNWWTNALEETDTNNDGTLDGVVGFAGVWTFWDGFSGVFPNINSTAAPILTVQLNQLGGIDPASPPPPGSFTGFIADLDLAADLSTSATFEIGDTDSDLQGADLGNVGFGVPGSEVDADFDGVPDIDANQDGLADFGFGVFFIQPGDEDTDNADGDDDPTTGIDGAGDPNAPSETAQLFGHPFPSTPVVDTAAPGGWDIELDGPTARPSADAFANIPADPTLAGLNLFFGGFSCEDTDPGTPGIQGAVPRANAAARFFGPSGGGTGGCTGDLNGDDTVDFSDLNAFVAAFQAGDPAGDLNDDGSTDFSDLNIFVNAFQTGCP